jgi:hypothetical protein
MFRMDLRTGLGLLGLSVADARRTRTEYDYSPAQVTVLFFSLDSISSTFPASFLNSS